MDDGEMKAELPTSGLTVRLHRGLLIFIFILVAKS